jgi:hypothetical protein
MGYGRPEYPEAHRGSQITIPQFSEFLSIPS